MFIINGEVWRLSITSPFHPMLQRPDGSYAVGACDDYTKTIYMSDELHGPYFKEVLCHEITHAAMFSYNIELDYNTEEIFANIISKYGHEIINITDKLFKDIQRGYR